ncbi:KAP NTPase domain-containing protein [Vibrio crassostreae]|nr:KAP NTPase domain-containing protein [Vibrio crassostreae]
MNKINNRFCSWKKKYSFDHCELDNKEYGKYLSSYLRNQSKPLVLNLNGSWGTGKTHFLKQMYSDLRFKHDYPVIYIDAWKSDFSDDPLLVLISEFLEQFQSMNFVINAADKEKEMLRIVAKFSKRIWNMATIGVGTYLSGQTNNSAVVEFAKTLTFTDNDAYKVGQSLTNNYKEQLNAIEDTKRILGEYLDYFNKDRRKIFVLVDELDRCRPTYAIEMLEVIKHFFALDNYIFVVATDTEQLSHSIKAVYGSSFDGSEYLSRFFNRSAALPKPEKKLFANLLVKDSSLASHSSELLIFGHDTYSTTGVSEMIYEISEMYHLSLRRMEQVFQKFEAAVLFELETAGRLFDLRLLLQLIAEYDSPYFSACYKARTRSDSELYVLPKNIKNDYESASDDILHLIFKPNNHEIKRLAPENKMYSVEQQVTYTVIWEVANQLSTAGKNKTLSVLDAYEVLSQLDEKRLMTVHSLQHDQHVKDVLIETIFSQFKPFINSNKYVWTRNDYFKAVELSSSIYS